MILDVVVETRELFAYGLDDVQLAHDHIGVAFHRQIVPILVVLLDFVGPSFLADEKIRIGECELHVVRLTKAMRRGALEMWLEFLLQRVDYFSVECVRHMRHFSSIPVHAVFFIVNSF